MAGFVTAIFCGSSVSVNFDQDTLKQLYGDNVTDKINQFFSQTPYALPLAIIFLVWAVVVLILGGAVRLGSSRFYTDLVQKKQLSLNTVFSYFNIFGKAFLLQLLMGIFIFLWSLLLIVPGIIASFRYAMAPYILMENPEMSAMDAIRASKEMMKDNKGRLFCLYLSYIGWYLIIAIVAGFAALAYTPFGVIVDFILSLFLIPYVLSAVSAFYLDVSGQSEEIPAEAPAAQE